MFTKESTALACTAFVLLLYVPTEWPLHDNVERVELYYYYFNNTYSCKSGWLKVLFVLGYNSGFKGILDLGAGFSEPPFYITTILGEDISFKRAYI